MHTIEQLNDGRAVYLNGHRVNVADVPIFRKTLALNNQYYDLQHTIPKYILIRKMVTATILLSKCHAPSLIYNKSTVLIKKLRKVTAAC